MLTSQKGSGDEIEKLLAAGNRNKQNEVPRKLCCRDNHKSHACCRFVVAKSISKTLLGKWEYLASSAYVWIHRKDYISKEIKIT